MTIRLLLSLLIILLFFSCTKVVELDIYQQDKKITLNCILDTRQDTIMAWLSWTRPLSSSNKFDAIKETTIILFEDGKDIGHFSWKDSSAYILVYKPRPDKTYKIEANFDKEKVWAETHMPSTIIPQIDIVNYKSGQVDYKIDFRDNPSEKNYYWIAIVSLTDGWIANKRIFYNALAYLYSNTLLADDFNRTPDQWQEYRFSFNNYIRIEDNSLPEGIGSLILQPQGISFEGNTMDVFLLNTDYHLDKYMKSSIMMNDMDATSESYPIKYVPTPIYSNIQNGTGIFGSVNSYMQTIKYK